LVIARLTSSGSDVISSEEDRGRAPAEDAKAAAAAEVCAGVCTLFVGEESRPTPFEARSRCAAGRSANGRRECALS